MNKYIIELDENAKEVVVISLEDGDMWTETMEVEDLEQLNSDYINEHFSDLQDTAYKRGVNDGSLDVKERVDGAYQKGLDDAWEAAKKIVEMTDPPYWKVFSEYKDDLFGKITASEAIEKLKAYEEKRKADDKIEVGDEVKPFYTDITGVVTLIDGDTIYVLWRDGSSTSTLKLKEVTKTGRHFDIASILEDMRND